MNSLVMIIFGVMFAAGAWTANRSGSAMGFGSTVERAKQPKLFMFTLFGRALLGAVFIGLGVMWLIPHHLR